MSTISSAEIAQSAGSAKAILDIAHELPNAVEFHLGENVHTIDVSRSSRGGPRRFRELQEAIKAYRTALDATVKYLNKTEGHPEERDVTREEVLARLWGRAGDAISAFDPGLGNRCYVKGQGWLDPRVWNDPQFKSYGGVSLNEMRQALLDFNNKHSGGRDDSRIPNWFPFAGLGFAVLTFATLVYLMIGPSLAADKHVVFNVWMAFCVACSGAFLGGTARANGVLKIPFMNDAPLRFSAIGGVALFLLTFVIMRSANP